MLDNEVNLGWTKQKWKQGSQIKDKRCHQMKSTNKIIN